MADICPKCLNYCFGHNTSTNTASCTFCGYSEIIDQNKYAALYGNLNNNTLPDKVERAKETHNKGNNIAKLV
jgi:DNA-directed RNA polymerase subunit M/transcription elongation factor TFIIS